MSKWDDAYLDYQAGMKYKDIAEKYGVSINTVKSWKSRKWGNAPNEKVAHKTNKRLHTKKAQPVIENDELTEQQKMFCLLYLQYFNATKAYQEAYQVDYKTANASGARLLVNVSIKNELDRLKAELQSDIYLDIKDLIREYTKQAFADITDFVEFGTKTETETVQLEEFEITDEVDENGLPVINDTKRVEHKWSFVNLKESAEVDGTLIQEVKRGRDGVSIKLYDKQKAMEALMRYLSIDDDQKREKMRLEIEKLQQLVEPKETQEDRLSDYMGKLMELYKGDDNG